VTARREWSAALGIQALGALATFGAGLLIAAVQGPVAQGRYGLMRAAADLALALALFGLPQGVVHLINHERAAPAALYALVRRHAVLVFTLGLLAAAALALALRIGLSKDALPRWVDSGWSALALMLAVAGWAAHGLQRVFVLSAASAQRFAWLTVVPALSLLAALLAILASGSQQYEWALAVSGVCSAWVGSMLMRPLRAGAPWHDGHALRWQPLLAASGHAMAQTVAMALQPYLALQLLQRQGAAPQEIGWFVFALYAYQAFALPAGFLAPLVVMRAGQAVHHGRSWVPHGALRRGAIFCALAAGAAALLLPWLVPALFGPAYRPAVPACVLMACAGPMVFVGRLQAALLIGAGRYPVATALVVWRVMLVGLCMMVAWRVAPWPVVTGAAVAWLVAEAAATLLGLWLLRGSATRRRAVTDP
jgi:O-antigen/teichoic acid export membrane protein